MKLYYYEAESDYANGEMPTWDSDTYTLLDTLAADEIYQNPRDARAILNTEVRDVEITRQGMYFAIQDLGACSMVVYVKIYSIICPSVIARSV